VVDAESAIDAAVDKEIEAAEEAAKVEDKAVEDKAAEEVKKAKENAAAAESATRKIAAEESRMADAELKNELSVMKSAAEEDEKQIMSSAQSTAKVAQSREVALMVNEKAAAIMAQSKAHKAQAAIVQAQSDIDAAHATATTPFLDMSATQAYEEAKQSAKDLARGARSSAVRRHVEDDELRRITNTAGAEMAIEAKLTTAKGTSAADAADGEQKTPSDKGTAIENAESDAKTHAAKDMAAYDIAKQMVAQKRAEDEAQARAEAPVHHIAGVTEKQTAAEEDAAQAEVELRKLAKCPGCKVKPRAAEPQDPEEKRPQS
jgi:hypothetical protein